MKFIAILAAFIVTVVGSSCATSPEGNHGRKLRVTPNQYYFSLLSPAQENPVCGNEDFTNLASVKPPTGNALLTYNHTAHSLCVQLTYSGLSGMEFESHIHQPAPPGEDAGVLFTFDPTVNGGPIKVEGFTLQKQDKKYLDSGLLYFNIHTGNCPEGEIRGQILMV
jgi:hypothetical protein